MKSFTPVAQSIRFRPLVTAVGDAPAKAAFRASLYPEMTTQTAKHKKLIGDPSFSGKGDQIAVDFHTKTIACGIGKCTVSDLQQTVHTLTRTASAKKITNVGLTLNGIPPISIAAEATALNLLLPQGTVDRTLSRSEVVEEISCSAVKALYQYDRMKSKRTLSVQPNITIFSQRYHKDLQVAAERGFAVGQAVNITRTLGNLRPEEGSPRFYTNFIKDKICSMNRVSLAHVIAGKELQSNGLELMYAVGKGSVREPILTLFEYRGDPTSKESVALVGKGLTFDCGGMNVKPYGSMESMHQDMMGAAAVIGTMHAAARLKLPINIVAVTAFAENAIGPGAYLPSSIIRSLNGKSVEVLNTDAEGRLVLADALTFLQKKAKLSTKPTEIIDLATLTGAIIIGLGNDRAGLFSNNKELMLDLLASGAQTNELLWPMPIGAEHSKAMKGGIADLINCAEGRVAGSCTAAAFLKEFVDSKVRWAHLDIAGTGMGKDKANGLQPAGVPGFGVSLLVNYLSKRSKKQ